MAPGLASHSLENCESHPDRWGASILLNRASPHSSHHCPHPRPPAFQLRDPFRRYIHSANCRSRFTPGQPLRLIVFCSFTGHFPLFKVSIKPVHAALSSKRERRKDLNHRLSLPRDADRTKLSEQEAGMLQTSAYMASSDLLQLQRPSE